MTLQDPWEEEAIHVVGEVISFWGFKENHGKIWALLYLKNQRLSTSEIRSRLDLSKGATSMLLQDLENWGVIHRIDQEKKRKRFYTANDNFLEMIANVLQHRESNIVSTSLKKLHLIENQATLEQAHPQDIKRLQDMQDFARFMKQLLLLGSLLNNGSLQEFSARLENISKAMQ